MTIDCLTREEFQAYQVVQEKKTEIRRYSEERNKLYHISLFSVGMAVISGGATLYGLRSDYISEVIPAVLGVCTLVHIGVAISSGMKVRNNSKHIGSLGKELEQLKELPAYKVFNQE